MPTYEYKCDNCGHQFDVYQSMKEDKLTKCPVCEKETLKRLIGTGGGLIFKGSGFYLTDYKNKTAEAPSKEISGTKETTSNTETKTEPASKESETKSKSTSTSDNKIKKTDVKSTQAKAEK